MSDKIAISRLRVDVDELKNNRQLSKLTYDMWVFTIVVLLRTLWVMIGVISRTPGETIENSVQDMIKEIPEFNANNK